MKKKITLKKKNSKDYWDTKLYSNKTKSTRIIKNIKKIEEMEEIIDQKHLNLALDDKKKLSFFHQLKFKSNNSKDKGITIIKKIVSKQKIPDIKKWYIIMPNSKIMTIWATINLFVIIYSISIIPYFNAFSLFENNIYFDNLEYAVDIFFIVDFLKNFFLSYNDELGKLELDFKKIIIHYLFTWFLLDLLTAIPFSLIFLFFSNNINGDLIKSLRTLKTLRIFKFLKNFNNYLKLILFGINIKPYFQRMFSMLIIIFVLFHNINCIWITIGSLEEYKEIDWITNNNLTYDDNIRIYIAGLYWTTQTIFTVGYGDVGAFNKVELFFAILIMFVGVFIYSFLVSYITSIINLLDTDEGKFNKNIITLKKINNSTKIPGKLFRKLKIFFKENAKINEKEEELLSNLEDKLQKDLYFEMDNYKLKDIKFFEKYNSRDFIAFITRFLRLIVFEKNENVYLENEISDNLYFIKNGSISIEKLYNNKKIQIAILRKGNFFGEKEMISGKINRIFTVVAITKLELLAINYKEFEEIIFDKFPEIGYEFLKKTLKRKFIFLNNFEKKKIIEGKIPRVLESQLNNKITKYHSDFNKKYIDIIKYNIAKFKNVDQKYKIYHFLQSIHLKNEYIQKIITNLTERMNNKKFERKCSKYMLKQINSKNSLNKENSKNKYNINIQINKYYYINDEKNKNENKINSKKEIKNIKINKKKESNNIINNIMDELK